MNLKSIPYNPSIVTITDSNTIHPDLYITIQYYNCVKKHFYFEVNMKQSHIFIYLYCLGFINCTVFNKRLIF